MQRRIDIPEVCYEIKNRIGHVKKLIVTDLDGTLLDNQSNLSSGYANEIKKTIGGDIKLTIASGRSYNSIRPFAEKLGIVVPIICEFGSFIIDPVTEKKIFEKTISAKVVRQTLDFFKNSNYFFNIYLCRGNTYKCFKSRTAPFFLDKKPITKMDDVLTNIFNVIFRNINDYEGFSYRGIRKISIRFEEDKLTELKNMLTALLADAATIMQSDTNCLNISPAGISKGTGLAFVLELCDVDPKDVMVIGDNETDVTMFELAECSVAMSNSSESTKQMADLMTVSNEEKGVLYAIREFLEDQNGD